MTDQEAQILHDTQQRLAHMGRLCTSLAWFIRTAVQMPTPTGSSTTTLVVDLEAWERLQHTIAEVAR